MAHEARTRVRVRVQQCATTDDCMTSDQISNCALPEESDKEKTDDEGREYWLLQGRADVLLNGLAGLIARMARVK